MLSELISPNQITAFCFNKKLKKSSKFDPDNNNKNKKKTNAYDKYLNFFVFW